ncbi:MAG: hypothetical protein AB8B56_08290 [Crocinitomicaceae bacterium]
MRKYEPYNPNGDPHKKEVLMTNRLFIISLTIYAFLILFIVFPIDLIISENLNRGFLLTLTFTGFCINVAGFVKGIYELKANREMAINGIVGNLVAILIVLSIIGYIIYLLSNFPLYK